MFKIDQFSAANEAAINQFAYFAQLSLANVESSPELRSAPPATPSSRPPPTRRASPARKTCMKSSPSTPPPSSRS